MGSLSLPQHPLLEVAARLIRLESACGQPFHLGLIATFPARVSSFLPAIFISASSAPLPALIWSHHHGYVS